MALKPTTIVAKLEAKRDELSKASTNASITADSLEAQIENLRDDAIVTASQATVIDGVLKQLDAAGITI